MSESSKMGLFGSKDDNSGANEGNKEPTKSKDNSPEQYAPYNIDSDSETYDTEALSIMDINDIIGVQAESAGNSTLESEFAALSEVITDTAGEFSSEIGTFGMKECSIGRADRNNENNSTAEKGSEMDSAKEDICKDIQIHEKKLQDSTGMASISKSLQLIGEAYISEDSQETDNDEIPESSESKLTTISQSLRALKNDKKDATVSKEQLIEAVSNSVSEQTTVQTEAVINDGCKEIAELITTCETVEASEDFAKNDLKTEEMDSTDSVAAHESAEKLNDENKTESMDVDPAEEVAEIIAKVESPTASKSEQSENIDKIVGDTSLHSATVDSIKLMPTEDVAEVVTNIESALTNKSEMKENVDQIVEDKSLQSPSVDLDKQTDVKTEESFEQMEVDETNDKVSNEDQTNVTAPLVEGTGIEIHTKLSETVVTEETITLSNIAKSEEEQNGKPDEVSDKIECLPESKDIEGSVVSQIDENVNEKERNSEIEMVASEISINEEKEKSTDCSNNVEVASESLEMETEDTLTNELPAESTESKSPDTNIEEPRSEISVQEANPASNNDKPERSEESPEKSIENKSEKPRDSEKLNEIPKDTPTIVEQEKASDNEPMEIDDATQQAEGEKENSDVTAGNLCDQASEIVEPVENQSEAKIPSKEYSVETVETAVVEEERMEVDGIVKKYNELESDILATDVQTVSETELKETSNEESAIIAAESSENISEVAEPGKAKITSTITTEASEVADAVEDSEVAETTESAEAVEVADIAEAADGVEDSKVAETTESAETVEVADSAKAADAVEDCENAETTEFAEAVEVTDTTEAFQIVASAEPSGTVDVAESVEVSEVVETSEAAKVSEDVEASENIEVSEVAKASELVEVSKAVEVAEASETVEVSKDVEAAETVKAPEAAEAAEASETSETTPVSKAVEVLEPVEAAETTEAIEATQAAEAIDTLASVETTEEKTADADKEQAKIEEVDNKTVLNVISKERTENKSVSAPESSKSASEFDEGGRDELDRILEKHVDDGASVCSPKVSENESKIAEMDQTEDVPDVILKESLVENLREPVTIVEEKIEVDSDVKKQKPEETTISTVEEATSDDAEVLSSTVLDEMIETIAKNDDKDLEDSSTVQKCPEIECVAKFESVMEEEERGKKIDTQAKSQEEDLSNSIENVTLRSLENIEPETEQKITEELISSEPENNTKPELSNRTEDIIDDQEKIEKCIPTEAAMEIEPEKLIATEDTVDQINDKIEVEPELPKAQKFTEQESINKVLSPETMSPKVTTEDQETSVFIEEKIPETINEMESEDIFPKCEIQQETMIIRELSSSSMNLEDVDAEEDPVDEEMNLTFDPENSESQEEADEETPQISELLSEVMDGKAIGDEIDDQTDINLSLDSAVKCDVLSNVEDEGVGKLAIERSIGKSFMMSRNDRLHDNEERLEKSSDENLKDILSSTVRVPEIFHDEQSQSTQEMMESILETDTGNLNKILDAEEGVGESLSCSNDLPLESAEIDELADKLPAESDMLDKALEDPMGAQNIDSLEGLLDLIPEGDEPALSQAVEPIVAEVMNETEEDMETIGKDVDVSLLLEGSDQAVDVDQDVDYVNDAAISLGNTDTADIEVVEKATKESGESVEDLVAKSALDNMNDSSMTAGLEAATTGLTDNDLDAAFNLTGVETNDLENADPLTSEETKMELAEDLLREIAVEEERKMELAQELLLATAVDDQDKIDLPDNLLLSNAVPDESKIELAEQFLLESAVREETKIDLPTDLLLQTTVQDESKVELADQTLLESAVEEESKMILAEDITLDVAAQDQVLNDVAGEIEDLPPSSEISELESAVKFLQESEEQDIDSPLVLSPKLVESVVEDIVQEADVGIFVTDADICEDPSELVAELESITSDPIAISEAEIISEAAKLENERKTKLSEEAKLKSPISTGVERQEETFETTPPPNTTQESSVPVLQHPETPKSHRESRDDTPVIPEPEKINTMDQEPIIKKSVAIPKISILEERLKEPPKIEIPLGEVSRICEMPTTPKTSLLIQRDSKICSFQKMMESPKSSEKSDMKIVDTPRKDVDKHDFENVGSPRIILKIAKSAIADCGEPRSPKSPKIRSATNSPNPEDSPGQKLGKIKLKLSKGGHPSIIPNDNSEEQCGQWHTEGSSSLSPLGMKIKFSKSGDASIVQSEKYEVSEESKEPPKHKFEEAKRTESPIGMKIKLSRTGDPSIVQQDSKESILKHKDKLEIMQGSPKRTESPIGMKIKLSKSGDASIIQPEKQETSDEHRDGNLKNKDKLDIPPDVPRRTESPLGMKIKLFKTGDASIVQPDPAEDSPQDTGPKRTDSPLGMKIKLSKTRGSASIVPVESGEDSKDKLEISEAPRRTESPLGMKIKLSKSGDASIIHSEESKETSKYKDRGESNQESTQSSDPSIGVKIKVTKSGDATIVQPDNTAESEIVTVSHKRTESSIGMKIKLSKSGDASIVHTEKQEHTDDSRNKEKVESLQESQRKTDSPIGMKIKLSKSGDASIIQPQASKKSEEPSTAEITESEHQKAGESSLGMKIKLQKSGDPSIVEPEKKEKSMRRKDIEVPLEMKIKLSKTGHPTIVACDNYGESSQRSKEAAPESSTHGHSHKHKESSSPKESASMKLLKSMHSANLHGNRSELTIEPVQMQNRKSDVISESSSKRKEITISPIEPKKGKLEAKLSQILPEVTIQPIVPRDQKQVVLDGKSSSISRQQINVISQEISITQIRSKKSVDLSMTDKLKSILAKNANSSTSSDCEIIEHRPELIIVNENSNSSQDVMIIEEVPALRGPEVKVPKKRGRPRRNPIPLILSKPTPQTMLSRDVTLPRDPLALDDGPQAVPQTVPQAFPPKENERPKRTCRNQKSYAPPRRGRGRGGRGKRKMEQINSELCKKPRIEQDLDMIENSTTALIAVEKAPTQTEISHNTSELYKALRQPPMDRKMANAMARVEAEQAVNDARNDPDLMTKGQIESLMDSRIMSHLDGVIGSNINKSGDGESFEGSRNMRLETLCGSEGQISVHMVPEHIQKTELMSSGDKLISKVGETKDSKDASGVQDHQNWLTPSSKRQLEGRNEGNMSNVQVIDEETRMSAESGSRSQTPARNMSLQAPETVVNEESQGSVLSTATTESEKVKVKNRRMEINFDPDEGPFTVDKVAEYEWPPDPTRKGETFMIQEQISQYLGVKSFKRKYPDLKRRMVDMEERNYLREHALVSEAMCDMGLTAVSSSEVLDIMCSDFPDQYEEYRKYIREKQMKEHSKKQKELTAAANAERNRIDLAEMAVQSALSWNVGLNKARRESRKCSLDLQTFTIHVPKKQQKVEEDRTGNHYPVALIPGQYTDYYREYTPAELRYYPLNTVLYGPMKPNERKFDSQSEGSQSDSDSDSSSDDSSSSSSEGTQDTEESQSTMDEVDFELSRQKEDIKNIKCKMCLKHLNKLSRNEVLIQCGTCSGNVHPSCIDLTLDMVPHIRAYAWQCTDCKTCAQCHDPADEDKMLFCDMCDRGYHIYCVGLRRVPQGRWHCQECAVCASCGSREAGGANSDRNSVAQWQHEYKKGDKNTRVYVSTLCVPCSKLWRKGRYCPHCSRCHTVPRLDLEANLVHCSACDKYLHLGCVETKDLTIDRKNYLCDFCQPNRQQMVKPLVSKVFRT